MSTIRRIISSILPPKTKPNRQNHFVVTGLADTRYLCRIVLDKIHAGLRSGFPRGAERGAKPVDNSEFQ
jgi:hypothetical protein